jgi:hypothetical protein
MNGSPHPDVRVAERRPWHSFGAAGASRSDKVESTGRTSSYTMISPQRCEKGCPPPCVLGAMRLRAHAPPLSRAGARDGRGPRNRYLSVRRGRYLEPLLFGPARNRLSPALTIEIPRDCGPHGTALGTGLASRDRVERPAREPRAKRRSGLPGSWWGNIRDRRLLHPNSTGVTWEERPILVSSRPAGATTTLTRLRTDTPTARSTHGLTVRLALPRAGGTLGPDAVVGEFPSLKPAALESVTEWFLSPLDGFFAPDTGRVLRDRSWLHRVGDVVSEARALVTVVSRLIHLGYAAPVNPFAQRTFTKSLRRYATPCIGCTLIHEIERVAGRATVNLLDLGRAGEPGLRARVALGTPPMHGASASTGRRSLHRKLISTHLRCCFTKCLPDVARAASRAIAWTPSRRCTWRKPRRLPFKSASGCLTP